MKIKQLLMLYVFFAIGISARLSINSPECNNYLKKFGTANSVNGVGPTSLAYTGDAAFVTGTANVQVNLRYSDSLYNDATYFGLTQEDGKTLDSTCLDLKLWKFTSSNYSDPLQITDLPFTATSNLNKKWRYISFTINGTDLSKRLVQTSNSDQYLYTGYYAVAYYAAGSTEVQYTYYFQFAVTVSRSTQSAVSTVFHPLNQYETVSCSLSKVCTTTASTKLNYCADASCTTTSVPTLFLNDQFYVQQIVTTTGLTNYYLTNTTVYYIGDGLNKQTSPISVNNTVPGQTILLLAADIAWNNVSIQVTSYVSTTSTGARRFLDETTTTTYDPVSGTSQTISCIKLSSSNSTCATCAEQCIANKGIAGSQCPSCFSSLLAIISIVILFFIY